MDIDHYCRNGLDWADNSFIVDRFSRRGPGRRWAIVYCRMVFKPTEFCQPESESRRSETDRNLSWIPQKTDSKKEFFCRFFVGFRINSDRFPSARISTDLYWIWSNQVQILQELHGNPIESDMIRLSEALTWDRLSIMLSSFYQWHFNCKLLETIYLVHMLTT